MLGSLETSEKDAVRTNAVKFVESLVLAFIPVEGAAAEVEGAQAEGEALLQASSCLPPAPRDPFLLLRNPRPPPLPTVTATITTTTTTPLPPQRLVARLKLPLSSTLIAVLVNSLALAIGKQVRCSPPSLAHPTPQPR